MAKPDPEKNQHRLTNQYKSYVSSREALQYLQVKPATLYTYVSRGWVRTRQQPGDARRKEYCLEDLQKLRQRGQRTDTGQSRAADSLNWGEPVLESSIADIREEGPIYRGVSAVELAERAVPLENVAELLWSGEEPTNPLRWDAFPPPGLCPLVGAVALRPLDRLLLGVTHAAYQDPLRFLLTPEAEKKRARGILVQMAAHLSGFEEQKEPPAPEHRGLIQALGERLGHQGSAAHFLLNAACVLCADHELNVSTFAVRVAASAGADLYSCLTAGLSTFSGPHHGGACDRMEALLDEALESASPQVPIQARLQRGEALPGLGHRLYPEGDPRARCLLESVRAYPGRPRRLKVLLDMVDWLEEQGFGHPGLEMGLVAVSAALELHPGMATGLFALGRACGWVAHALEQREQGQLLRPRAHYTGA